MASSRHSSSLSYGGRDVPDWSLRHLAAKVSGPMVDGADRSKVLGRSCHVISARSCWRALSQRAGISTASFRRDLATPRRLMELVMSSSPGLCLHLSCHGRLSSCASNLCRGLGDSKLSFQGHT
eukprot:3323257-Amphidinium_carterae.1